MKKLQRKELFVVVGVGIICMIVGYLLWPTPLEEQLRARLNQFTARATITTPLASLETRIRADELVEITAPVVAVHYRASDVDFEESVSQTQMKNALTATLMRITSAAVVYSQFKLLSSSNDEAKIALFVIAEWKEHNDTEASRAAEQTEIDFKKIEGEWKIVRIETFPR